MITVAAVGDVFLDRPDPGSAFSHVQGLLRAGDVTFANSEGVYAGKRDRAPSAGVAIVAEPGNARPLAAAGINVVSLANNHSVDGGHSGLLETLKILREQGIATAGAGADVTQARDPAVRETPGGPVAVLAYASVFPHGYEARARVPGLAPLRARTLYTPWEESEWNPGLLPRVTTIPYEDDYRQLRADIAAARERAVTVIASFHWGDFTRPYVITDHERRTARAAIDAGADAVLGHHHHLLRGMEFYNGKPILYGLGHFAFDLPKLNQRLAAEGYLGQTSTAERIAARRRFGDYALREREGYPLLPFHEESRMTMIAVLRFDGREPTEVGFVPCWIEPDGRPRPLLSETKEHQAVLDYVTRCCAEEELAVDFRTCGNLAGHQVTLVRSR